MRVIGTAGHVDHGKSTLVRALSGIDPDRLQEEKKRGMTIDLGFAWIELPMRGANGATAAEPVGIIDVPGHIDFIKNMLAGVGGIDAAMLVIAADEGVMPQTREHLAILDLLAVPAGLVALTKIDLIDDPEWLELVQLDIAELLQQTHLADAPIVPVSAATGKGLIDLRSTLARILGQLAPRRNRARPRLPVDRVFSLSGFGTVATGTLSDGHFAVGDTVEILPTGHQARIRGLQTHKQQLEQSQPGSRLAINLSGVDTDQVRRGDVIAKPGTLQTTMLIDVQFRLLADARPLVHNQTVDFFSGASEIPAIVRLLGVETLEPGQTGWLQLRLERPAVVVSGDRYILRQPSPSATLGGGIVLSPHPRRRWRRFDPAILARLQTLAKGSPDEILLQTLSRHPFLTAKALLAQSELDLTVAQDALDELLRSGAVTQLAQGAEPALVTIDRWEQVQQQVRDLLDRFHQQMPLRRGMARGELRSRLQSALPGSDLPLRLFNAIVERMQQAGQVAGDDSLLWRAGFSVQFTLHQQQLVDYVLAAFAAAPYSPPNEADVLRQLGNENELLEALLEQGLLVRISGNVLFRRDDFTAMVERVRTTTQQQGSITLAQVRDLFDTSRKYAQAILEEMDARRITKREGDVRVLR
ncbi:MAG: selenocysteine-specific translation elongation factor [Caldilinea sp. CFX5]|nr:selenocysteine-specific translation elongation factor [Caldilinea sp. CFX5]